MKIMKQFWQQAKEQKNIEVVKKNHFSFFFYNKILYRIRQSIETNIAFFYEMMNVISILIGHKNVFHYSFLGNYIHLSYLIKPKTLRTILTISC